ncbi:glycosyl transferase family 2 [Aurantimonas sp. MSK8Z-1]|uniref:glycosyl transferase family 2 n=1 Tax=Mangrovibrevibacter kandeliae TaxID=2968473 RepID=UPI0021198458|nr:glycosyl transferase family 2 [Aurantimonas sp. MSK8Z-1]MCW4116508.1 glycosyl transferase family 2 [Aurantimonas sp. MSK8Z-1]
MVPLALGSAGGYPQEMLSVFIETRAHSAELALTLASLVPGAVEGVIREVVVVEREPDEATRKVADNAGCRLIAARQLAAALRSAKGEWLLWLEPGARLSEGWTEPVVAHLAGGAAVAARFHPLRPAGAGWSWRLRRGRSALRDGLLLPRAEVSTLQSGDESLDAIARRRKAIRLPVSIRPSAGP